MNRGAKRHRMGVGYRERLPTAASLTLIVTLIVIRARWYRKSRTENESSTGGGLEKPTPQYRRTTSQIECCLNDSLHRAAPPKSRLEKASCSARGGSQ